MKRWILISSVCLTASAVHAGPMEKSLVSGTAKFVAHVDLARGRETAVGKVLLAKILENEQYLEFENLMVEAAGFMPASDAEDLTIWGEELGPNPKAVIVLHAKMDAARLRGALENAPDFKVEKYAERELLSWRDDKKDTRVNAAFLDERTMLISGDAETLKRGVDVAGDEKRSMAAPSTGALALPAARDSAWAFVSGVGLNTAPNARANPVLSKIASGVFEVVQAENAQTEIRLAVNTTTADQAPRLLQFATGMKAMAEMNNADKSPADPKAAALVSLLETTKLEVQSGTVSATATIPDAKAESIIETLVSPK